MVFGPYSKRIITSSCRYTPSETLRNTLHWMTLSQRRQVFQLSLVHRCIHDGAPKYLSSKFTLNREMQYARTQGQNKIYLGRPCTNFYRNSFEFQAALSWNRLPSELKELTQLLLKGQYVHTQCCDFYSTTVYIV